MAAFTRVTADNASLVFKIFAVLIYLSTLLNTRQCVEVRRPRGVALTKNVFYDPSRDFNCIDGSDIIPFVYVNDDYCDCGDGSDEPGTPACPNGVFHCTNAGFKPMNIPSSRVNDGICDCCDASDEYNSTTPCINNCKDLGRKAREEFQQLQETLNKGYKIRLELAKQGKQLKEERKRKLTELEKEKEEATVIKEEKEEIKNTAEEPEKQALEKYKNEEDERKKVEEALTLESQKEKEAADAFNNLDVNSDGKISLEEVQSRWVFDSNKDGKVAEDEAKFFLQNKDEMDLEEFLKIGWPIMKPHYSLQNMITPPEDQGEQEAQPIPQDIPKEEMIETDQSNMEEDEDDEQDDEEDEDTDSPTFPAKDAEPEVDTAAVEAGPQYDEETQILINTATQARSEFDEADKRLRDVENEIRDVKTKLEIDFGEDEAFASLQQQCIEFSDREYVYKACLFEQISQRPLSGGSETGLGRWGKWEGPEDNKYMKMKYEHGLTCWNGPARSTLVTLICGTENKITFVAEPSRCEYVMDLYTPAVCTLPSTASTTEEHTHEEL